MMLIFNFLFVVCSVYDVSASKIRWRAMQPLGTDCVKKWIPGIICTTEDSK